MIMSDKNTYTEIERAIRRRLLEDLRVVVYEDSRGTHWALQKYSRGWSIFSSQDWRTVTRNIGNMVGPAWMKLDFSDKTEAEHQFKKYIDEEVRKQLDEHDKKAIENYTEVYTADDWLDNER